jgi:hypothetical protein
MRFAIFQRLLDGAPQILERLILAQLVEAHVLLLKAAL